MNYNTWHIPQSWQGESFSPASCGYCVRHGHVTRIVSASSLSPHGFRSRLLIHGADPVGRPPPPRSGAARFVLSPISPPPVAVPCPLVGLFLPLRFFGLDGRERVRDIRREREGWEQPRVSHETMKNAPHAELESKGSRIARRGQNLHRTLASGRPDRIPWPRNRKPQIRP